MNVHAVIHHVYRGGSDVSVAFNRSEDPKAWARAHHLALTNMHECQRQAQRWGQIADELDAGRAEAASAQLRASLR